ncbi:MAG: S-layer homology domain-containing protein [Clostridia bacterium]|nr:S-layer homology domain-containing protein [Clostridia bacterium]
MRLKYKIRFAALAVIVIIGIAFYAVANNSESLNTTNVDFEDVNESDWFYGDVEYAVQNGLMNGTGDKIFAPEESTTRGMIVTILWRAEGKPASETDISFIDVEETAYYYGAVKWAAEN